MIRPTVAGKLAGWLEWVVIALLGVTLALVPFESRFLVVPVDGLTFTELELAITGTLAAWALLLIAERRLPRLPRPLAAALLFMAAVSTISSLSAPTLAEESLRFTFRSLTFWLIFSAAADVVRREGVARALIGVALVGAAGSGAAALFAGSGGAPADLGPGRLFAVAGITRAVGTFDYPNTAAMAWEAAMLAGAGLAASVSSRWLRAVVLAGVALVAGAMLLTFSRGALLGTVAAAIAIAVVAAGRGRKAALAVAATGAAAVLLGAIGLQIASGLPLSRLVIESNQGLYGATYSAADTLSLRTGAAAEVPVSVTNSGSTTWQPTGDHPVRLAYHWLDPTTGAIAVREGARTDLPAQVSAGQTVDLAALVVAPPKPGVYLLGWDMTQEDVTWFSDQDVPMRTARVDVTGPEVAGSGQAPPAGVDTAPSPEASRVPSRTELWGAAIEMVRTNPVLGVGPGTFRLRYGGVLGWSDADIRIHANDIYLELAATTGILGLVAFLAVVGLALIPQVTWLRWSRGPVEVSGSGRGGGWALRAGLLAVAVAFLAHGIVDYFFAFTGTAILFWALLGIGVGLSAPTSRSAR